MCCIEHTILRSLYGAARQRTYKIYSNIYRIHTSLYSIICMLYGSFLFNVTIVSHFSPEQIFMSCTCSSHRCLAKRITRIGPSTPSYISKNIYTTHTPLHFLLLLLYIILCTPPTYI